MVGAMRHLGVSDLLATGPGQLRQLETSSLGWLDSTTRLPCKTCGGCHEPAALPRPGRFRAGPSTCGAIEYQSSGSALGTHLLKPLCEALRRPERVARLTANCAMATTRPWTLMEVCGGQTHGDPAPWSRRLLPDGLELIHGPGCPVCVTPAAAIDRAPGACPPAPVILCSYWRHAAGAGIGGRSLLDSVPKAQCPASSLHPSMWLAIARDHPGCRCGCFFAVGFETTAPPPPLLAHLAWRSGLTTWLLLVRACADPPGDGGVAGSSGAVCQGFTAAGHVCAVRLARS